MRRLQLGTAGTVGRFLEGYRGRVRFCHQQDEARVEPRLEKRQRLTQAYLDLKSDPDALPALKSLRERRMRLAFLSNLTPYMLDSAIKSFP